MKKAGFLIALFVFPALAVAGEDQIVTLTSENDTYASGRDQYYTNGARASYLAVDEEVPDLAIRLAEMLPFVRVGAHQGVNYSIGHNLYTPDDITRAVPDTEDRPYAALLYGSVGFASASEDLDWVDEFELMFGIVGPWAQGEIVQKRVHEAVDALKPQGWDKQLDNEPVLNLFWQRRWPRYWQQEVGPLRVRAEPQVGLAIGNAFTHASVGGTVTLAPSGNPFEDAPVRVRPAAPGTGYFRKAENSRLYWSVFGGVEGRAVGRNIFLDGNTFTEGPSVAKHNFVYDAQAGVTFTFGRYRIGYTAVYREKEFAGQDDANVFGAISFSFRY